MSAIRAIRERLQLTQIELGKVIGSTQGSVSFYEQGTIKIPPDKAGRLIEFAKARGVDVSFDDVYAAEPRAA